MFPRITRGLVIASCVILSLLGLRQLFLHFGNDRELTLDKAYFAELAEDKMRSYKPGTPYCGVVIHLKETDAVLFLPLDPEGDARWMSDYVNWRPLSRKKFEELFGSQKNIKVNGRDEHFEIVQSRPGEGTLDVSWDDGKTNGRATFALASCFVAR